MVAVVNARDLCSAVLWWREASAVFSAPLGLVLFLGGGVILPSYDTNLGNRITEGKDNIVDTEATVLPSSSLDVADRQRPVRVMD